MGPSNPKQFISETILHFLNSKSVSLSPSHLLAIPCKLYKYQTFDQCGFHLTGLSRQNVYFSKARAFDDKTDSTIDIDKSKANNYLNEHYPQFVTKIFACTIADELAQARDFDYDEEAKLSEKICSILTSNNSSILNGLILC